VRWVPSFKCSRQAIRDMFSFGAGIYAKNLLDYAVQNLDNLVVGRVIGITALGFYDKAYSTMSKLTAKINLSGPSVSFRIFALIEEDRDRFRRAYRKVVLSVTLIAYPILTGLILVGPELINVMYGARWMPAVVPFQILCVAAMFRTLNTYASSATQAKGQIWSEVHRQALFTIVLVAGVATGSSWGISGAAAGVLISTAFMTVLLQALVRRLSGLSWGDMLGPQVPAFVCTAGLIVIVLLTKRGLNAVLGNPPAPIVLILCVVISAVYYGGFLLFARFSDVREVVHETASDLAPGVAKRLRWMQPQTKEIPALPAR
jgi:PST family polysaccharide transporter